MMDNKPAVSLGVTLVLLAGIALAMVWLGGSPAAADAPNAIRCVATTGEDVGNTCMDSAHPCRTLQHAVDATAAGDTILVASGVYTDVHTRGLPPGYAAPPGFESIVQVVMVTKTVSIRGGYTTDFAEPPDPLAHPTTLDAGGQGRVVAAGGPITVTLNGLRVVNGDATGLYGEGGPVDAGGGVYAVGGTMVVSDCVFTGNKGYYGGGLFVREEMGTIANSTFVSNTGYYGAGLRFLYADGAVTGNAIERNEANAAGGVSLMYCEEMTFSGNDVVDNTATGSAGGGLYLYACDALVSGNTFERNEAPKSKGGALYLDAASGAVVRGNTIRDNSASSGGGLSLEWSDSTLIDNLVTGNSANSGGGVLLLYSNATLSGTRLIDNMAYNGAGGGAWVRDSDAMFINVVVADNRTGAATGTGLSLVDGSECTLVHSTIARNGAAQGIGVDVDTYWSYPASAAMTNTIVTGQWQGVWTNYGEDAVRMEATLWWDNETDWGGYGSIVTGTIDYWGDPLFQTDGYHLRAGSAAIDRGVPAGVLTDVDNEDRPAGSTPDLGADEWWGGTSFRLYVPVVQREYGQNR
jgi:parallel beta-helix repeat protein